MIASCRASAAELAATAGRWRASLETAEQSLLAMALELAGEEDDQP
jgi:hypothetical protein